MNRYVRKINNEMDEAPASPVSSHASYLAAGYRITMSTLPLSRLDIVGGEVDGRGIVIGGGIVELPEPPGPDTSAFDAACAEFRAVCGEICALIGAVDFHGGFEEMDSFQASGAATTAAGMALAIRWIAADKRATYEGAKLGLGQPAWWYHCWGISPE